MEFTSQTASFCDELRKAREYQGLSLDEIARVTRISREYLDALESGKLEVIPAPIRRGVVSAYARASGMNAEKVLKTLEELQGVHRVIESGSISGDRSSRERMTVGMTRAQIRTAWFASIADNPFLHWALTVLVLLLGIMVAAQRWQAGAVGFLQTVRSTEVGDPVSSFRSDPWMEAKEVIPDSLRYKVEFPLNESEFTALDTGWVRITWGIDSGTALKTYPHDKIKLMHYSGVRVASVKGYSGLLVSGTDTSWAHSTKDSTVNWWCFPDAVPDSIADSTKTANDKSS